MLTDHACAHCAGWLEGDDQQGDVAFFTRLCTLPGERLAELWRELLEADNLSAGAFGYVLGLQYGCNIIVLSGRLPIERLSARALAAVLSHFTQVAHGWRSHLTQATLAGAKMNGQRRCRPAPLATSTTMVVAIITIAPRTS